MAVALALAPAGARLREELRRPPSLGTFEIGAAGGGAIPTYNVHGVAPRASIVPIQLAGGGQPLEAMDHAVANGAQVLNFSIGLSEWYYGKYAGRDGVWLAPAKPLFRPLVERGLVGRFLSGEFAGAARALDDRDIVVVWAAGNEGWNSINNRVHMCGKNYIGEDGCRLGDLAFTAQEFMENFSWLYEGDDGDRDGPVVSFKDMWGTDCGGNDCADYNSIGGWAVAPLYQPGLLGKWLVVGALDENGEIARFSNGCGEARNWCLFAPGKGLRVGPDEALEGTSFTAPMASGALAVLRSRLPGMPMEVVQAVLLVSADPLGTRVSNPDEPGHAARDMLVPAGGYRLETHGVFAEFGQEAGEVHTVGMDVSAGMLGRWRLHHDLCDDCEKSTWRECSASESAGPVAAAPFFAHSGGALALQPQGRGVRPFVTVSGWGSRRAPWRQYGLRWQYERAGFGFMAELSRIDESRSFWGADFGALGHTRTETRQSRLFLSSPLGGSWRGFASYEHGTGEVSATGGMLSGISGLRAEGWSAGAQGRSVLRDDDTVRFTLRQEATVRGGQARIDHVVAAGSSFVDAFYRGAPQSLESRRTVLDLRARPTTRLALGYGLPLRRDTRLALGLEYEDETRDRGISARLRMDI